MDMFPCLGHCKNAVMNIGVHIAFQVGVFLLGIYTQKLELLDHAVVLF